MTTIRRVGALDMKRPENIRDLKPAPDLAPRPASVPVGDWPSGFTLDEGDVLAALADRDPSTLAALVATLGHANADALRTTTRRLADRGLVVAFGPYGSAFRLTRPTGRALARLIADNRRGAPTTPKE